MPPITSAPLSDVVLVCVSQTLFGSFVRTGIYALGPVGVLAIKTSHAPAWLARTFDQGELTAENAGEDEIKHLAALVAAGHATVFPRERTRFLHVPATLCKPLGFGGDESSDEDDEDSGSSRKKRRAA